MAQPLNGNVVITQATNGDVCGNAFPGFVGPSVASAPASENLNYLQQTEADFKDDPICGTCEICEATNCCCCCCDGCAESTCCTCCGCDVCECLTCDVCGECLGGCGGCDCGGCTIL